MERPKFITDAGGESEIKDAQSGEVMGVLPRYGVWRWDAWRQSYQCFDVGSDLEALKLKHGVEGRPIMSVAAQRRALEPKGEA